MSDDPDPILEAVAALRAAGIEVQPAGEELERWRIGDLMFSEADVAARFE